MNKEERQATRAPLFIHPCQVQKKRSVCRKQAKEKTRSGEDEAMKDPTKSPLKPHFGEKNFELERWRADDTRVQGLTKGAQGGDGAIARPTLRSGGGAEPKFEHWMAIKADNNQMHTQQQYR